MAKIKFKYEVYNPNPYHVKGTKATHGDCVIRAICKASGLGWFEVYDRLCARGREMGDFGDRISVYPTVLKDLGFKEFSVSRAAGKKALNVQRFIEEHPTGTYILRLAHHATAIVDGVCYDTWFPQGKTVYRYWQKI